MKKTTQLRTLLHSPGPEFLLEAHNGISAQIVEEAGFRGIWASSLSISAALSVRDDNELSSTEVLNVVEFMSDATSIPILMDGDTGYGDFNNVRRLVKKLESRSVAGVCIEDKLFPKKNSFVQGEMQSLADIEEFCGKIKAAKDTQSDRDFVVVARTEAFIAGFGLSEAIRRAEAYRVAGADAILVHSRRADTVDIDAFTKEWNNRHPIVIVPTKYYQVPASYFETAGISVVIWANHNLRASITAMQRASSEIAKTRSVASLEGKIAPLSEVFRLQRMDELLAAERKYASSDKYEMNAVILAASQGKELDEHTREIPKALVPVNGKPIICHILDELSRTGVRNVEAVVGFGHDRINIPGLKLIVNREHAVTTEIHSLYCARESLVGNTLIAYGDVLFKSYVLDELQRDESDIVMMCDAEYDYGSDYREYVQTDRPYSRLLFSRPVRLITVSSQLPPAQVCAEFIGLWKVSPQGAMIVRAVLDEMALDSGFPRFRMADLFTRLAQKTNVSVRFIKSGWIDIDTMTNLQRASGGF